MKNLLLGAIGVCVIFSASCSSMMKESKNESGITEKSTNPNIAFLQENKTKDGVKTTFSGLQYKVITEGTGPKPRASDTVKVNYRGTLVNGTEFDKSASPISFGLSQVISGWTEGLQLMNVGSKYVFYIPSELGYGDREIAGAIPANSTLIFEVELLGIQK